MPVCGVFKINRRSRETGETGLLSVSWMCEVLAGLSSHLITWSVCCICLSCPHQPFVGRNKQQVAELCLASQNKTSVTMCHLQSQLTALRETKSIPPNRHRKFVSCPVFLARMLIQSNCGSAIFFFTEAHQLKYD